MPSEGAGLARGAGPTVDSALSKAYSFLSLELLIQWYLYDFAIMRFSRFSYFVFVFFLGPYFPSRCVSVFFLVMVILPLYCFVRCAHTIIYI